MIHGHYHKDVRHLETVDVYRVLALYGVTDQAIGHAVKKLLCAGQRGAKSQMQDVQEAIDTLQRYQRMVAEDGMSLERGAAVRCKECTAEHCACVAR